MKILSDRLDIAHWLFTLLEAGYQPCCVPDLNCGEPPSFVQGIARRARVRPEGETSRQCAGHGTSLDVPAHP